MTFARGKTLYKRVIPRDLFNESKLLKCLGQLALIIHDGVAIRWPLAIIHDEQEAGFSIEQDPSSGDLFCANLHLEFEDREITVKSSLNSKEPFPLIFESWDGSEGNVFAKDGTFSEEFMDWLDSI